MVMVSKDFASLNPGCWGRPRPAGFPHAHTRISNILGHGYKLMAISVLLAIWLVPWPKPRLGHGLGNGLKPKAVAMSQGPNPIW